MNRKSGSGSGPFLMEMLVVVGFFIICASICVLVFVKADNISKNSRDINQAVLKAQSLAEELKAGETPRWSEQLPDRDIWKYLYEADQKDAEKTAQEEESAIPAGFHAVYWDSAWQESDSQVEPPYLGIISQSVSQGMETTDIIILKYKGRDKGNVLYRLKTETYIGL